MKSFFRNSCRYVCSLVVVTYVLLSVSSIECRDSTNTVPHEIMKSEIYSVIMRWLCYWFHNQNQNIIITAKFWKLLLEVCIGKYNIWNKHLLLLLQSICRHVLNIENHFRQFMSSRKVVKMHEVACRYMYFHTVRRRVTPNMTNMFGSCILQTAIIIGQFSVVTVT